MGVADLLKSDAKLRKQQHRRRRKKRLRQLARVMKIASGLVAVLILVGVFQVVQGAAVGTLPNPKAINRSGNAQILSGRAVVVDGDTIRIKGQKVRLFGIDAPETSQLCTLVTGARIRCGAESTRHLERFLRKNSTVACRFIDRDRYGRFVGDCYRRDGKSLSAEMVRAGQALDWPKYSNRAYSSQQNQARIEKLGIWAGRFEKPWQYRSRKRAG